MSSGLRDAPGRSFARTPDAGAIALGRSHSRNASICLVHAMNRPLEFCSMCLTDMTRNVCCRRSPQVLGERRSDRYADCGRAIGLAFAPGTTTVAVGKWCERGSMPTQTARGAVRCLRFASTMDDFVDPLGPDGGGRSLRSGRTEQQPTDCGQEEIISLFLQALLHR